MINLDLLISYIRDAPKYNPLDIKRIKQLEALLEGKKTIGEINFELISFEDLELIERFQNFYRDERLKLEKLVKLFLNSPRSQGRYFYE